MTALGLVNTLRAKTRLVDTSTLRHDDYGWGTCKVREILREAGVVFIPNLRFVATCEVVISVDNNNNLVCGVSRRRGYTRTLGSCSLGFATGVPVNVSGGLFMLVVSVAVHRYAM